MRVELARILATSDCLTPKLQEDIYNSQDHHALYYLAKREDLLFEIQEKILLQGKFTSQWSQAKNRPEKLISMALRDEQSHATYMQLAEQIELTHDHINVLLSKEVPMLGYSLAKRKDIDPKMKLKALKLYSKILDLSSTHQNKQEFGNLVGSEKESWFYLLDDFNLENIYLLTLAVENISEPAHLEKYFIKMLKKIDYIIMNSKPLKEEIVSKNRILNSPMYHYEDLTPNQHLYLKNISQELQKPLIQEIIQIYRKIAKSPSFKTSKLLKIIQFPFFEKVKPEMLELVKEDYYKSYRYLKKTACQNQGSYSKAHLNSLKHLLSNDSIISLHESIVVEETIIHSRELDSRETSRGMSRANGSIVRDLGRKLASEARFQEIEFYLIHNNSLILDQIEDIDPLLEYLAENGCKSILEERVYLKNPKLIILKYDKVNEIIHIPYLLGKVIEIIEDLPSNVKNICYSLLVEWDSSLSSLITTSQTL